MSNYSSIAAEAGDRYLELLAQGQDQFVEYIRSAREMMPQVPAQFAAHAPALPFDVPSVREVADAQFKFASKLLKQQEGFIRRFYSVAGPAAAAKPAEAKPRSTRAKSKSTAKRTTRSKSRASR